MGESSATLELVTGQTRFNWSAIWAGVFTFFAIWFVFGVLCLAIFAGTASFTLAMSVWGIILTLIAMFVAGRATGALSGVTTAAEGMLQGMVMFGLAVTSALVVLVLGVNALGAITLGGPAVSAAAAAHTSVVSFFTQYGWALFVGLLLGWLGAMSGASSAHKALPHAAVPHEMHREAHA
jgi:hypothetical protein